ncbi:MAG TPA: ion channel [Kribbella sp.]|nr:ion channel [Kribbella sp.]
MHSMAENPTQLPPPAPRWRGAWIVLRSLIISVAIVVAYFIVPMRSSMNRSTLAQVMLGIAVISALLVWQIRAIVRSAYPRARAVGALTITVPLFLIIFATIYFMMGQSDPDNWSQPLSRLDAAYYTVTMFATVGFGDITGISQTARAVTTVQMIGNLVLVGLIARVFVSAAQEGLRRQGADRSP